MIKRNSDKYTWTTNTASTGDIFRLKEDITNSGTWIIHNASPVFPGIDLCKYCGDQNACYYRDEQCFVCWRNRNPGALER